MTAPLHYLELIYSITLLKVLLNMMFYFPRWDMWSFPGGYLCICYVPPLQQFRRLLWHREQPCREPCNVVVACDFSGWCVLRSRKPAGLLDVPGKRQLRWFVFLSYLHKLKLNKPSPFVGLKVLRFIVHQKKLRVKGFSHAYVTHEIRWIPMEMGLIHSHHDSHMGEPFKARKSPKFWSLQRWTVHWG